MALFFIHVQYTKSLPFITTDVILYDIKDENIPYHTTFYTQNCFDCIYIKRTCGTLVVWGSLNLEKAVTANGRGNFVRFTA